jgi:CHASE2 domain-containing sensor protein
MLRWSGISGFRNLKMNWGKLRTVIGGLGLFFAGVGVLFVVENFEILDRLPVGNAIKEKVNGSYSLYQLQMRMIPRPLESHYVTLVSLTSVSEGPFKTPCETRAFFAKLLPRLIEMRPAMIVSDVGFGKDNCGNDMQETKDLVAAIKAASDSTPIVVAQGTKTLREMTEEQVEELRRREFDENDLLLNKSIPLPGSDNLRVGLIRMNADLKKIPIRWYVWDDEKAQPRFEDSLSFAAAKRYRAAFPDKGARLQKLERAPYHPYASFLSGAEFSTVPAIQAMCDQKHALAQNWRECGADEGNAEEREKLHGRILMIGFGDDPKDLWQTVAGRLPGYALQANYLEALLDARVFLPLSLRNQLLLSFAWLLLVELPFWLHDFRTGQALFYSCVISCFVIFLLYYLALVNLNWYISVGPPSVLAIVARVAYQNLERKAKHE